MICDMLDRFGPYQNHATALYWASRNGHHDIVKALLKAGADVDIVTSVSDQCCNIENKVYKFFFRIRDGVHYGQQVITDIWT